MFKTTTPITMSGLGFSVIEYSLFFGICVLEFSIHRPLFNTYRPQLRLLSPIFVLEPKKVNMM